MKKMFLVMAVLLLVAPAMAEVKITCVQGTAPGQDNIITVSYDAISEANLPRAFALDITLTDTLGANNAVISSVTPAKVGESNSSSRGYGIFLGSDGVDINEDTGEVNKPPAGRGWGNPAANPADPCAQPGIGTNAVTVELASLYKGPQGVGNPNAPPKSGAMFTFTVNNKACHVTVSLNARRGGIVKEDPDEPVDANLPGVGLTPAFEIRCPGDICGVGYGPRDGLCNMWDYNKLSMNYPPQPYTDSNTDLCGVGYGPKDNLCNMWDYNKLSMNYPTANWQ